MNIDDDILNVGVIAFELGIPLMIAIMCLASPKHRRYLLPILGSISLAVVVYAYILFGYFFLNREKYEYAYSVVWVMSFFVYLVMLVVGVLLSLFVRKKFSNMIRYILGVAVGGITVVGLMVIQ